MCNFLRNHQIVFIADASFYIPISNAQKFSVPFCFDKNMGLSEATTFLFFLRRYHTFFHASHTVQFFSFATTSYMSLFISTCSFYPSIVRSLSTWHLQSVPQPVPIFSGTIYKWAFNSLVS